MNTPASLDQVAPSLDDFARLARAAFDALPLLPRVLRDVGVDIELVPDGDDPKNLFRFVRGGRGRAQMRRVA